jgi:LacI family repressor for deo operon, udp, cdd, tsx, nupC, and nupG
VLHGIDVALSEAGYAMITGNFEGDPERARRLVDLVFGGHLDGILTLSGQVPTVDGRSILDAGLPVVSVCAALPGGGAPAVLLDDGACARAQLEHLLALGHRKILYVAGPEGNYNEVQRFGAIREYAETTGPADLIIVRHPGNYQFSGGVAAAESFLAMAERPTAVIACNDEMAIGFIKGVRRGGLAVPRDVSVVGFDGIEMAEFCEPSLTTIRQPRFALGASGAELLLTSIATGTIDPGHRIVLPGVLSSGESTGSRPG